MAIAMQAGGQLGGKLILQLSKNFNEKPCI
jgi:hypothetical protein